MELVETDSESPTLISNVEVMQLLQKRLEERTTQETKKKKAIKKPNKHMRHRDWIEEEVHKYLQSTPCVRLDPDRTEEFKSKLKGSKRSRQPASSKKSETNRNGDDVQNATTTTATTTTGYGLTAAESLQIMNMMPLELVEIHLMVDDLQSRMSETQQEEFLEFIQSYSTNSSTEDPKAASEGAEATEENDPGGDSKAVLENGHENGKPPPVKVKKEIDGS